MGERRSLRKLVPKARGVAFSLFVCSALLGWGLYLPLLNIEKMFWENSYSVATGVFGLWDEGQWVLATIVFFWSVAFPIGKLLLLWRMWFWRMDAKQRHRTLHILEQLGRWSMLDVFIVAVLIVAAKLGPLAEVHAEMGLFVFGAAVVASMLVTSRIERLARGTRKLRSAESVPNPT
jgi:paraquat-inducible protein A